MAHRLRCLQDFAAEGLDALVRCGNPNCQREVRMDPRQLLDHIRKERYIFMLQVQAEHLECGECGSKGKARIAPVLKQLEPYECWDFKEDVWALHRRVMQRALAAADKTP